MRAAFAWRRASCSRWPLARLQAAQFAFVTFALAAVVPQIANYQGIARWTGGSQGLGLDRPEVPFGLPLSYDQWIYLLTLLVLVLLFGAASNLLNGPHRPRGDGDPRSPGGG